MAKLLENYKLIFSLLLLTDVAILTLHLFLAQNSIFFHLDFEDNLPAFYQSAKLILFGCLFFVLSLSPKLLRQIKLFVTPLALVMVFLGLDELLQIHENSYRIFEHVIWLNPGELVAASAKYGYHSSLWVLYYLPIILLFLVWCGYWLKYFRTKHHSNFWIVLATTVLLGVILMAEVLSSAGDYSPQTYYWLVTIEEIGEMILATVLVFGGLKVLDRYLID